MNKISELSPKTLWAHFAQICGIPHPSGHEAEIRKYIVDFAKKNNLEHTVDEADNVIVRKPATTGMEGRKGIVLQAHLDMVPQKNGDKQFDFAKDPIEAYVDGDEVTAKGTTLGADNGIGVAAALAVLEAKNIAHGALEALFTASEETGMDGAFGLKAGELAGEILLNLDSETEGELYVGCAGGMDANIVMPYAAETAPHGYKAVKVKVTGLKGGHSGIEIILQRANANKLLFRLLRAHLNNGTLLASVDGGGLRNAIPREAEAVLLVSADHYTAFTEAVKELTATIIAEYKDIEDAISVEIDSVSDYPATIIPTPNATRLADAVIACPNGVIKMSTSMPGLVQTSNNLARVVSDGESIKMQALMRSSVGSEKDFVGEQISAVMELAGAETTLSG
ncbi:MAG: beta-Ala-His dipeptidase, partial [Rikenellaceae bacterium]|nr:beta-Ala-His dipeptidase [Rikenellaceae bacterium]